MTNKKGFTLVELLVSISIIAVMMAIAIVSYGSAQKKARDSRRAQDIMAIAKAAEQYYSLSGGNYPTSCGVGTSWSYLGQTVLQAIPNDPKYGIGYTSSCTATSFCYCGVSENGLGNSTSGGCQFQGVGGTGSFFCMTNTQ